jgi:arsenite methyltransferase
MEGVCEITGGLMRPGGLVLTDSAFNLCGFSAKSLILDAGCGMGCTGKHLTYDHGMTVCGVDASGVFLARARHESSLPLVQAVLEALPFPAATFDGIICECTLSQTLVSRTLEEFRRTLKAGACLILSDLYLRGPSRTETDGQPHKVVLMREDQIISLLIDHGFSILHFRNCTADLKRLAVELIMAVTLTDGLPHYGAKVGPGCPAGNNGVQPGLGYYLLVARRGK